MLKNIYLAANKNDSQKTIIALGLMELLTKKVEKIAYFKPVIHVSENNPIGNHFNLVKPYFGLETNDEQMYAFTFDEAEKLISNGKRDDLLEGIVKKYKELEETHDFVFCDGTDFDDLECLFEMNLNARIASILAAPVFMVIPAKDKDIENVVLSVKLATVFFKNNNCDVIGTIINRVPEAKTNQFLTALKGEEILSNQYLATISESPDLEISQASLCMFANQSKRIQTMEVKAKCQTALNILEPHIDSNALSKKIIETKSTKITPKLFEYDLVLKAKKQKQNIVLPESLDDRILKAAESLLTRDIADITLLGNEAQIKSKIQELGLNIENVKIIDPKNSPLSEKYIETFYELRKSKGITLDDAKKLIVEDLNYFGTMMVHMGDAAGMVSGAIHSTAETIRPGLQIIKTKPGISIVSSVFLMCLADKVYVYGDCAVNTNPGAEELANIAITSAETGKAFGIEPRVALLSYSTGNSGTGPDVDLVKEATEIAKKMRPDLKIEGPLQYDAAVSESVAATKMPNSEVAGKATIFVFPDLNTGNNTYKAVQRETGAIAIGPILQGLNKPINDLSRGCTVPDIINTVIITAIQSQK